MIDNLDNKIEQLRYYTEFKIVKDSIQKLNPEFSLCTVLVAYHGDNRNRSSISKEVFDENLWSIYGIPIIGEWIKLEEDQNKETWGSHGGRIILDDSGLKYEQTTRPFGFVTEEAYKNASWVTLLEKDGHTEHEYLKLEKCILWNSRYEECDSILEENFGQSMEISEVDGSYRQDGYFDVSKFVFSALCILGNHCAPCFESAMVGRQYELNQFKQEFTLMMDTYKEFNLENTNSNLNINSTQTNEQNIKKEDDNNLKNNVEIKFSDVCAKIELLMSETTYSNEKSNKKYEKYKVLFTNEADSTITVVDRENGYSAYSIPYIASQVDEDLVVNIDYESKKELTVGVVEKTDAIFNVKEEVDMISTDISTYEVGVFTSNKIVDVTNKYEEAKSNFEESQAEVAKLKKQLAIFEGEKKQYTEQKHKDVIDALVSSRREEMGKFSEFLEYCLEIDYSKTVEQIQGELKEIHYNYMLKNKSNGKKSFSAIEVNVVDNLDSKSVIAERYGADMAKYFE